MILIAFIHIGVGISVVSLSSFVNSEMKFIGWNESIISIYLGFAIIFELFRLVFGYLHDKTGNLLFFVVLGGLTSFIGLLLIPSSLTPIGNIRIIFAGALFYSGSAICTTLIDTHLTKVSVNVDRNRIAGILQTLRLTGFAMGGFLGSYFYSKLDFSIFIFGMSFFFLLSLVLSLIGIYYTQIQIGEKTKTNSTTEILSVIKQKNPILMSIYLFLYPIGLFMQDLVLEPFAIENLHFEKTDVGKIVAIWTSLTLVFVPIGIKLIPKFGRLRIIVIGTILSSVGLIILTINSIILDIELFYIGLIIFGIGNGLNSGTGIGVMLDICASYPKNMSVLLGYFGVLITFGRFVASIIGGLILNIFELRPLSNYFYLFGIESFITIITIIPMIILHRNINVSYSPASSPINPIDVISMSDL